MYRNSFKVKQEVEVVVEVGIDEVLEHIDHGDLMDALLQDGYDVSRLVSDLEADEVLDEIRHEEIVNYVAQNVDTDEVLNALKEYDDEGLANWVKANVPAEQAEQAEESKPAPTIRYQDVFLRDGAVRRVSELDNTIAYSIGTYNEFSGLFFVKVDADITYEYVAKDIKTANAIAKALVFAASNPNPNQEV